MAGSFDDIIRQQLGMTQPSTGAGSMFDIGDQQNAPGLLVPGNINTHERPIVHNRDGSISTVRSASFTDDNGRNVLIPTVIQGRGVVPVDQAIQYYKQTGQHLGMFDTPENATSYAESLHQQQADEYQ